MTQNTYRFMPGGGTRWRLWVFDTFDRESRPFMGSEGSDIIDGLYALWEHVLADGITDDGNATFHSYELRWGDTALERTNASVAPFCNSVHAKLRQWVFIAAQEVSHPATGLPQAKKNPVLCHLAAIHLHLLRISDRWTAPMVDTGGESKRLIAIVRSMKKPEDLAAEPGELVHGGSRWSQDLYLRAYIFAARAHHGQALPGTDLPYIVHLGLVSMEVISGLEQEPGLDGNLAVQCALLHDVLEDTNISYDTVSDQFGERVARGVRALTKNFDLPDEHQMKDVLIRLQQEPTEVQLVKLADRIVNLQPPPFDWDEERVKQYREEAYLIYESLRKAHKHLAARLLRKIETY